MIGDLILFFKEWWKQNITCIHDYRYREIGGHSYKNVLSAAELNDNKV